MYYLWVKNIKNGSHGIIYTYKNYFVTVFSISAKISCIQMNPKCELQNTLLKFGVTWILDSSFDYVNKTSHSVGLSMLTFFVFVAKSAR